MKIANLIRKRTDWEGVGYQTMLASNEEASAIESCRYKLHAYALQLQPRIGKINFHIGQAEAHRDALYQFLYDQPVPVDDAAMLPHSIKAYIVLALCLFAAGASFVGNFLSLRAFGWEIGSCLIAAIFMTGIPLTIGHLAYERILSGNKSLQVALVLLIVLLGSAAFYEYSQSRQLAVDKATTQSDTNSYIDDGAGDDPPPIDQAHAGDEARAKSALGHATLFFAGTAELALLYLAGLLVALWTDKIYTAWRNLKTVLERIGSLEEELAESQSRIEEAKTLCMAGMRRAMDRRSKRRVPYHKSLIVIGTVCVSLAHALPSCAQGSQNAKNDEVELIDASSSIDQNRFADFLHSTKRLLASEPPSTRVWVSLISKDSFGAAQEVLTGWTPEAHGVFTDNLDRARRQLAVRFEANSSGLTPSATGTDIFGSLWYVKALFDSGSRVSEASTKTIWIFSDMRNETKEFPVPELLEIGPERMFEKAKTAGLVVPLPHYKIYVCGASTVGLSPRSWQTIKRFWEMYFTAAGATLVSYTTESPVRRVSEP